MMVKILTYRDCRYILPLFGIYLTFLTSVLVYISYPNIDALLTLVWALIFITFISALVISPLLSTRSSEANFPTTFSRAVGSRSLRYLIPFHDIRNKIVLHISSYLLGERYGRDERQIIRENSEYLVGTAISIILLIRLLDIWDIGQMISGEMRNRIPPDVAVQIISNFTIDYGSIVSALGAVLLARGSLLGSISKFKQDTNPEERALEGAIYEFWGFVMLFVGYSFIIVESFHILLDFYVTDFWIWAVVAFIFFIFVFNSISLSPPCLDIRWNRGFPVFSVISINWIVLAR